MTENVTPAPIVVYLRCRPAEPEASAAALDQQQAALAAWLIRQRPAPAIVREITESEDNTNARPTLVEAIALCKAQRATLIIVSTQPIGTGQPFEPRIASVPVTVLPQPKRSIPVIIPLPPHAGDEVTLFVDREQHSRWPVYLINPKPLPLTEVTITLGGFSTALPHGESMLMLGGPTKTFARIDPHIGQLIETRNVMAEGESIDFVRIRFREGAQPRQAEVTLSKLSQSRFIALTCRTLPNDDADHRQTTGAPL